ncbi:Dam family site-specific DNA-(adenine-N6)-methyltransferase [Paraburkholderia sediminicola]|uniref:Dam family site-specific DNA-(Adenine-N6)-methyltransferase n=1 Tax=Paraburkholderia rhynchosiae TaxID=487049 RepID=A0ACC7N495_9BURK
MEQTVKPLLRWAGSKRKLLPVLRQYVPTQFSRYVEPFCGSACLFFALSPERGLLGDINPELIHFYKRVRANPNRVGELFHAMPTTERFYYDLRAVSPESLGANDRAARFLYLNRFCFNGVYRTNRAGVFNVPRGVKVGAVPSAAEIAAFGRSLRRADVEVGDFESVLAQCDMGDFVYLDPPYAGRGVRNRGEYGANSFSEDDIGRLHDALESASSRGAKILISYGDVPAVRQAFSGWQVNELSVGRNVSGFVHGRREVQELLITNY